MRRAAPDRHDRDAGQGGAPQDRLQGRKDPKPKKSKGKKLVVASQTPPARVKGLTYGTKINLTMKIKKKKR